MTTAIAYVRISQDRAGESLGVTRQEDDARALAAVRGWGVVDVVIDNDISAAGGKKRPGFERVLSAVEAGQVDVVIAWTLDRLTRNRRDTVRLIEACQQRGATIALVRGSDLDLSTPAGRLTADLLAAVARSEIETKSDRQQRAALQAAEQGRWVGGRRPFGYDADGMTVREDEARAVKDAYAALLDGASVLSITRKWNAAGLYPPQTKRSGEDSRWTGTVVSRCLKKPRYAGLRSYKGEVMGQAQWPALVDVDTWHAARAVMGDPARRPNRGDQRLLTGVALCGVCDGPVHAGGGATGRGVYRCASTSGHFSRTRQPVDEYVSALVVARLSRPDAAALFAAPAGRPDSRALIVEADQVRARLVGLAEAFADGDIDTAQMVKGTKRLRVALLAATEAIAAAHPAVSAAAQLVGVNDVQAAWDSLEREAQREVIRALMIVHLDRPGRGARTFDPTTVRIDWR